MSEPSEELFYRRALRRIYRNLVALTLAGSLVALLWKGWPWGLGFLLGAAASTVNFRWLHQLVDSLGPGGRRPSKKLVAFVSLRYLLLGLIAYVIVKYFGVNLTAALAGLLVVVAAVLLEILYELIYARA